MARLTKYETNIKPYLAEIEKDVADGMTETSLAAKYSVSYDMWAKYKESWSEFSDAIKRGNRCLDKAVENALAKSAKGYFVEESEQVFDSKGSLVSEKKKKRYIPPSQTAQVFWLKNRCKDTWKDRSVLDIEEGGGIPKVEVVVKDLSDGGLLQKRHLCFYEHSSLYLFCIPLCKIGIFKRLRFRFLIDIIVSIPKERINYEKIS